MSEFKFIGIKDELPLEPSQRGELYFIEVAYQLKRIADSLERRETK